MHAVTLCLVAAVLAAAPAAASWMGIDVTVDLPMQTADVALKKFYDDCNGKNWPSPWKDRWGTEHSCAWDGNERGHPSPFGTRCATGHWHQLPPNGDGGLLFFEHYSRAAECDQVPREFESFYTVDNLSLWNNKLKGPIWNTTRHTFMHRLDLSENQFSGSLPDDFMLRGVVHTEIINLGFNKFSGKVPGAALARLGTLQALRLNDNEFSGPFPAELATHALLKQLDLSRNKMTGAVISLKGMKALARLDLSHNSFEGGLPELPDSISHVKFTASGLKGQVPDSYAQLPFLRHFECVGCELTCSSPELLAHLPFSTHCHAKARAWL